MNEPTLRFTQWIEGHPYLSHGIARLLYASRHYEKKQRISLVLDFILYRGYADYEPHKFASDNLYALLQSLRMVTKDESLKSNALFELTLKDYLRTSNEIEWENVFELEYKKGSRAK